MCVCVCVCVTERERERERACAYEGTYISHIFIHLSIDGNLGSFYVLAIINGASMCIGCTSFAATWTDLEIIILSEVSQRKTNNIQYHLGVES